MREFVTAVEEVVTEDNGTPVEEQYTEFNRQLVKQCGGMGIDLLKLTTAEPYHIGLGAFLGRRARRD